MTHKQVWTEIAGAFLTSQNQRGTEKKRLTQYGLCYAIDALPGGDFHELANKLNHNNSKFSTNENFWLPTRNNKYIQNKLQHTRAYDLIRGDFATLMACMTKKEFNKLLAGTPAQQKETL